MIFFDYTGASERAFCRVEHDFGVERVLEEALQCLMINFGNVHGAIQDFKFENIKKELRGLSEDNENNIKRYRHFFQQIVKWFEAPAELTNLPKGFPNLNREGYSESDLPEVAIPAFRGLLKTNFQVALPLLMVLQYRVDHTIGITANSIGKPHLKTLIDSVWENAMNDLHPFQRGPTHQGTKHCIAVRDNLGNLKDELPIHFSHPDEVWAGLSVAAAIHDTGKGDIFADVEPDVHAHSCARLVRKKPDLFNITIRSYREFVAKIVECHNHEGEEEEIDQVKACDITINTHTIPIDEDEVKKACALFQLADVMDTTQDRVSIPEYDFFLGMYENLDDFDQRKLKLKKVEKIINARQAISGYQIKKIPQLIELQLIPNPSNEQKKAVKARIEVENKALEDTGAASVLKNKRLPYILKEKVLP